MASLARHVSSMAGSLARYEDRQLVGTRIPRSAAKHPLLSLGRSSRVLGRDSAGSSPWRSGRCTTRRRCRACRTGPRRWASSGPPGAWSRRNCPRTRRRPPIGRRRRRSCTRVLVPARQAYSHSASVGSRYPVASKLHVPRLFVVARLQALGQRPLVAVEGRIGPVDLLQRLACPFEVRRIGDLVLLEFLLHDLVAVHPEGTELHLVHGLLIGRCPSLLPIWNDPPGISTISMPLLVVMVMGDFEDAVPSSRRQPERMTNTARQHRDPLFST